MFKYDYLIVGAGLFGSIFAHEAQKIGKKCLVIEKRNHIGGNIYTENINGINIHKYGAHIFHTSNKKTWDYMNQFSEFNNFINSPMAIYKNEIYNLPFNMNTFSKLWGIKTPNEAKEIIEKQINNSKINEPKNLEEYAINLVGNDIYEKLIKGYTEKQWGRLCNQLPTSIIKRIPLRFTYDNNYFSDRYQGIPIGGYTKVIENMLANVDVLVNTNYFEFIKNTKYSFDKTIYTGPIDEFFGYSFGNLEYRSLKFETKKLDIEDYQGNAVINYTGEEVGYTRIIEHKHFEFADVGNTVITYEYPMEWQEGMEQYYPINDEKNNELYMKYYELSMERKDIIFGGRLGEYKYYDMDKVVEVALKLVCEELNK